MLLIIAVLVGILLYNVIVGKKKSDEPYSYRPLSDKAEEEDLDISDEEDVGRGKGGMGALGDMERGEGGMGAVGDVEREEHTETKEDN